MCLFTKKNLPKGRHFTYLEDPGIYKFLVCCLLVFPPETTLVCSTTLQTLETSGQEVGNRRQQGFSAFRLLFFVHGMPGQQWCACEDYPPRCYVSFREGIGWGWKNWQAMETLDPFFLVEGGKISENLCCT